MSKLKYTEEQLAEGVIAWLERDGWEVFQEVTTNYGLIDIVAKQGSIIWAIECKKAFGFPVLEQAYRMLGHAHYVSIAVSVGGRWNGFGVDLCDRYSIGIITAGLYQQHPVNFDIQERTKAKLCRRIVDQPVLREEQKRMGTAGSNRGGHWTPFKSTRETMIAMVNKNPGIQFNDLLEKIDHHYASTASARGALSKLIGTSAIPELKTEHISGKLCVLPV